MVVRVFSLAPLLLIVASRRVEGKFRLLCHIIVRAGSGTRDIACTGDKASDQLASVLSSTIYNKDVFILMSSSSYYYNRSRGFDPIRIAEALESVGIPTTVMFMSRSGRWEPLRIIRTGVFTGLEIDHAHERHSLTANAHTQARAIDH